MIEISIQNRLADVASHFGKLVFVASLRDENKGTYRDFQLEKEWKVEEVQEALRQAHRVIFYDWLTLDLQLQTDDLLAYLNELSPNPADVLGTWKKLEPYRGYVPADTGRGDRELFVTDLRTIVDLLLSVAATY